LHNPINAPYKLLDFVFFRINPHNATLARLASVVFALTAVALFFSIMYRWHGKRTAILATVLFGTSSWLLHVGRLGVGGGTLVLVPLILILFVSWLNATERHGSALVCMAIVTAFALFTAGAVWFLAASYLLAWKTISKHVAAVRQREKVLSAVILVVALAALGYAVYRSPHIYKEWLALPTTFPAPLTLIRQWLDSAAFLFVRGPYAPDAWLAHTPLLDVFTEAMAAAGGYFYVTHYKNLRSHMLAAFLAIGSMLVALNGAAAMSFVVPVAYLIAGTGLTYALHEWLRVFPRNPIARGVGVGPGATAQLRSQPFVVAHERRNLV
jgi:hypothetical protein